MAITKKDVKTILKLVNDAQHTAWIEGWAMGEAGGEKNRNPYPRSEDINVVMNVYRLLNGTTK